jgi:hypothetical protein
MTARRVLPALAALLPAYLLLVQRPAIVGIGSALGGMWTFYLAAAALIVLIDRLTRPCESFKHVSIIAALVGFILVTHLYTLVPLGLLAVMHILIIRGRSAHDDVRRRWLKWQAAAGIWGVLSAGVYWIPMVLARDSMVIHTQDMDAWMVLARLVLPTHVLDLLNGSLPSFGPGFVVEALPMVLLVVIGVAGTLWLGKRRGDVPLYGTLLAAVLLTLLLFVTGQFDVKIMGPGSWRMLYYVRVGLALAGLPLLAKLFSRIRISSSRERSVLMIAAVAVIALGWWFGHPLRQSTADPRGAEMMEVESLWRWLEANNADDWGRVYLQDTFDLPNDDVELSQSHVLALTAQRTGVRQLGAGYGVAPYRTARWTPGEFKTLFRRWVRDEESFAEVVKMGWAANATHIVTSDAQTADWLGKSELYEEVFNSGRFRVYRSLATANEWASPLSPGVSVTTNAFETGRYRLTVRAGTYENDVLIKSSFHPNWRLSGVSGARLVADPSGLMRIAGIRTGQIDLEVEYESHVWPAVLSLTCWLVILSLSFARRARAIFR